MLKEFSRNWWLMTINGIIAILLGVFAIFIPNETIVVIAKYFGLIVLIGGVILLIGGINNIQKKRPYAVLMVEAIVSIILGLVILIFTQQTLELFVILVGIWAIILGLLQLALLASIKDEISGKSMILVNGLITLIFGILIFFNPFTAVKVFTVIVGLIALFFGIVMLYYSFILKKYQNQ